MEGKKKSPLEGFQEKLQQQHKNAQGKINNTLYEDILKTAKIIEKTEDKTKLQDIITNLRNRFKNENLNQVTDIYIYCQSFLSSNENPVPLPSQLCISIGKLFTNENLHYTANKVYSKDEVESGCALSFLGCLALHEHHEAYVLRFIKENFEGFSQNKKTECVFQLKEILPDNEIANRIIEDSGITEYKLVFSTEEDSTSKPISFQVDPIENSQDTSIKESKPEMANASVKAPKPERPWWKFW